MPGTLILCATPIGNLDDASPRLAEALAASDVIYCEDTRRSRVLLGALGVSRRPRSYFVGNEAARQPQLMADLEKDLTVALLTDAGTPAISDPGWSAVNVARQARARVTVVPGPSALTAALAVSGFPTDRVVFEGFLPRRDKERQSRLESIGSESRTIVVFAAANHLEDDLGAFARIHSERPICIARELTKKFEEIAWMTCREAADLYTHSKGKGEFTLVLSAMAAKGPDFEAAVGEVLSAMDTGQSMTTAVRGVAEGLDLSRRKLYEAVLARTRNTRPGP